MDAVPDFLAAAGGGSGGGGLYSILFSESRDFLVAPNGNKVNVGDIEGKMFGLYFSANWYFKCESFTPLLASVYDGLKEQGHQFEVVFISSDEDQASFEEFHRTMPWPAIPFSDLQSKKGLTQRFQIEGIPSLVIVNTHGETIHSDAVELINKYGDRAFPFTPDRIAELQEEDEAKHASQTLEKILSANGRDYVISHEEKVPISCLAGKTVGLYFTAHQCTPSVKFTPRLVSVYQSLKENNEDFEIVFVSMDKDEAGFLNCYTNMPWLALPYEEETLKVLSRYFNIQGIPSLIIIGPDGKTVSREGRNLINLHLEMAYPFTEAKVQLLQERMNEEAKSYPRSFDHVGHRHILNLVSENSGGGPFICCECDEQGFGWAYQCIDCGYEIHLKCVRAVGKDPQETGDVH